RRRTMLTMRALELAGRPIVHFEGIAGLGIDQLGVDEAARAHMHPVLLLALPPERHADVADAHRLGHPCAPAILEPRPEGRLAAAGLAGHEDALDAGPAEVDAPLRRPLEEVRGIGGR